MHECLKQTSPSEEKRPRESDKKDTRAHLWLDELTKEILHAYGITAILDVGAYTGQSITRFRDMGFDGKIISFEPCADAFNKLANKFAGAANQAMYQCGISRAAGRQKMNTFVQGYLNSMAPNGPDFEAYFKDTYQSAGTEYVNMATGHNMLTELIDLGVLTQDDRIFLKLDCQGTDVDAFQSFIGHQLFRDNFVAMQSEVYSSAFYSGGPSFADSISAYSYHGFQLAGVYPYLTEWNTLRLITSDVLMVKSDKIVKSPIGKWKLDGAFSDLKS